MKIVCNNQETSKIREFLKKEWTTADKERFGRNIELAAKEISLAALDRQEVVGILQLEIGEGVMKIKNLIVGNQFKRQGIGRRLIKKAEKLAKENDCHKLFLITPKGFNAVDFYKAMGFKQTGELKKHYLKKDWLEFSKYIE